jgi:hypothetical protein
MSLSKNSFNRYEPIRCAIPLKQMKGRVRHFFNLSNAVVAIDQSSKFWELDDRTNKKTLGRQIVSRLPILSPRFRLAVAWSFILLAAMSAPLLAQAPPSGDTFVSSGTPKDNYGSSITIIVGSGTTSYVQFNLSGIPSGAAVRKAMLRLYVDAVVKSGSFDVYQLDGSWNENTLTYNTPPPPLGASATGNNPISISSSSWNQFLLIDITSLVQGWVNGTIANKGVALALTPGSNGYFSFDSKESLLTGNGPESAREIFQRPEPIEAEIPLKQI